MNQNRKTGKKSNVTRMCAYRHGLTAVAIVLSISLAAVAAEPVRVMSFNIRFGSANDGENHWEKRKDLVVDTIREFAPDLLGTQETLRFQADFIAENLPEYTYFGRSRMKTPNEHCGIFFRTERFTQLAGGHFWLSEQPEMPESKSWDSSLPRMVSWVLLNDHQNEAGEPILFVNTHFDHRGVEARLQSAKLIRDRIKALRHLSKDPAVIVTGDFNTGESTAPYQALVSDNEQLVDSFRAVHPERTEEEGTFGGWKGIQTGARIDWILVDPRFRVQEAEIVHKSQEDRYPSDHYPVTAVVNASAPQAE